MNIYYLCDFHELIEIILAVEKGFLFKYHASKHAAQGPHVKGIIVLHEIYQKFRTLKVSRSNSYIVFPTYRYILIVINI
jgi:hypothetical protein